MNLIRPSDGGLFVAATTRTSTSQSWFDLQGGTAPLNTQHERTKP